MSQSLYCGIREHINLAGKLGITQRACLYYESGKREPNLTLLLPLLIFCPCQLIPCGFIRRPPTPRGGEFVIMPEEVTKMTVAQTTIKEDLCRRILNLPDEAIEQISRYVSDFEAHEPNEETIAVLTDSLNGRNLSKIYDDVEEMLSDLLKTHA
jgi:hypothetical protein